MTIITPQRVEELFSSLSPDQKMDIISHGVALRMTDLHKRMDMAKNRVRQLEEKYGSTLEELEARKLPDDAGYEMHENYILWHHWVKVVAETRRQIADLDEIAQQGLYLGENFSVSR